MVKKSKVCLTCGRNFEFRKKWKNNWELVKYCSERCKTNKTDSFYKNLILKLLNNRSLNSSICPSEVLNEDEKQNKNIMEQVRQSARLLVYEGKIVITQKGQTVDPNEFKGPIRLKLSKDNL